MKFILIPQWFFKSVKQSLKHACLVLFSSFCTIGAALNGGVHSHQVLAQSSSLFSNAIDSYYWVNSLYDGIINCFSTLAQSSVASNETFNYKEALQQPDKIEFVKAMVHEVDDHETQKHWTLIRCCDLPDGTKMIMAIWSFKRKCYPDGTLNKHKAQLCAHGGMQTWVRITEKHMLQLSIGLASEFFLLWLRYMAFP